MVCEKCNLQLEVGMFPFCRGSQKDHIGQTMAGKTPLFPFTVNHVNGTPMVIESMQHLRSVEKNYGVAFSAFNKDNINDLDPLRDVPKYRGDEIERRR
mgnify:CR=1 FL=1